jgi:hypothetical protein
VVADDLIATAGHCVNPNDVDVRNIRVVFGYQMTDSSTAATEIPSSDVYSGAEVTHRMQQEPKPRPPAWLAHSPYPLSLGQAVYFRAHLADVIVVGNHRRRRSTRHVRGNHTADRGGSRKMKTVWSHQLADRHERALARAEELPRLWTFSAVRDEFS